MNRDDLPVLAHGADLSEGAALLWRGMRWRLVWRDRTRAVLRREEDGALITVRIDEETCHASPRCD
ncbi:MAG: hypothetical protein AB1768_15350 [Pseudomonadota bacterium]|jgi:hypothetical protein